MGTFAGSIKPSDLMWIDCKVGSEFANPANETKPVSNNAEIKTTMMLFFIMSPLVLLIVPMVIDRFIV